MKTIEIEAAPRERIGKGGARTARREGRLPVILYGKGKSFHLTVDRREFVRAMQEADDENVIFDVKVEGESVPLKSIAREVQHHPVSRSVMHVDFQHIDMKREIHVAIAVHLVGEPEGVRNYGGILEHVTREVEVACLPTDIPSHFDVDVSGLMIGDAVHVSDIAVGEFRFLEEETRVVAHVAAPTVEKVEEPEGEEGEEGAAASEEGEEGAAADGKSEEKGEGEGS